MNIGDLMSSVRNDSIESFVPLSAITEQSVMDDYNASGYNIGYTYDEFKAEFPRIDADKIFFCRGFNPTYYFDREKLILFGLTLYGRDAIALPNMSFQEYVLESIREFIGKLKGSNYYIALTALSDRMRMEYLNLLLDAGITQGMYERFINFYTLSDYGCNAISAKNMELLVSSKSTKQINKTRKALKDYPNVLTLYRGVGERSTPIEQAWSWTLNINQANFFASRYGNKAAKIVTATVPKDKIVEYIKESNEGECLVNPKDVTLISTIELYNVELIENMSRKAIVLYHKYRDIMQECLDFDSEEHGAEHTARVLFTSLLLADMLALNDTDKETLATAAIYHDIGRTTDDTEDNHGAASARYYRGDILDYEEYNPVSEFLIKYHSLPDQDGYTQIENDAALSKDKERNTLLFNIFKDADALDRVRFDIRLLDINQLRLAESKRMTMVARLILEGIKL